MTREEAIDRLTVLLYAVDDATEEPILYCAEKEAITTAIEALEQPEQKKGMWKHQTESLGAYEAEFAVCSVCKDYFDLSEGYSIEDVREFFAYCPHCGAKMEGE